jgi:hypothetical protein
MAGRNRRGDCALSLPLAMNRKGDSFVRASPYLLPPFPLGMGALSFAGIAPLLCRFPHVRTADAQSKRLGEAYKPRIMYHMQGMVRGRQRGTAETGRTADARPAQDRRGQRPAHTARTDSQITDPTTRVLAPPFAWRGRCAGENTLCRKIYLKI